MRELPAATPPLLPPPPFYRCLPPPAGSGWHSENGYLTCFVALARCLLQFVTAARAFAYQRHCAACTPVEQRARGARIETTCLPGLPFLPARNCSDMRNCALYAYTHTFTAFISVLRTLVGLQPTIAVPGGETPVDNYSGFSLFLPEPHCGSANFYVRLHILVTRAIRSCCSRCRTALRFCDVVEHAGFSCRFHLPAAFSSRRTALCRPPPPGTHRALPYCTRYAAAAALPFYRATVSATCRIPGSHVTAVVFPMPPFRRTYWLPTTHRRA